MTPSLRSLSALFMLFVLCLPLGAEAQDRYVLKPTESKLRGARGELGLGAGTLLLAPVLSFFVARTGHIYGDCNGNSGACAEAARDKRRRHDIGAYALGIGLGSVGVGLLVHGGIRLRRAKQAEGLAFVDANLEISNERAQLNAVFQF